jgi:hypothetical protein
LAEGIDWAAWAGVGESAKFLRSTWGKVMILVLRRGNDTDREIQLDA